MLSRQPPEIRQFLTRTSILGRFCAPLCDAVSGSANAAEIIDVLERENLFIVPLDETRQWFRYHHLFAQVLRSQLVRTEPDIVPALHQRASAWHRAARVGRRGDRARAGRRRRPAGHRPDRAATGSATSTRAGSGTVRGWIRSLGDDQIAANPLAAHCAAWAAALSGDRSRSAAGSRSSRPAPDDGPLPDGMRSLRSSAALLRGVYGFDGLLVMRESARHGGRAGNRPRVAVVRAGPGRARVQPVPGGRPGGGGAAARRGGQERGRRCR